MAVGLICQLDSFLIPQSLAWLVQEQHSVLSYLISPYIWFMSIPIGKKENPLQPKIQKTPHELGAISRAVLEVSVQRCVQGGWGSGVQRSSSKPSLVWLGRLSELLHREGILARQLPRVDWLKAGDRNTTLLARRWKRTLYWERSGLMNEDELDTTVDVWWV